MGNFLRNCSGLVGLFYHCPPARDLGSCVSDRDLVFHTADTAWPLESNSPLFIADEGKVTEILGVSFSHDSFLQEMPM